MRYNHLTPNLMKRIKKAHVQVRKDLSLAKNIRFVVYDANAGLEVLLELMRRDYPHPQKEAAEE